MNAITSLKPTGDKNGTAKYAVIYARYSSSSQTEQSIEGQLRICKEYAQRQGYTVINEYIDRAKTGTNTNRPAFQNMIADSEKRQFQVVLVYMIDRFARSKEDSVIYKGMLRRNGVKVLSATEQIGDTDEGYLVEGLLEMFAEQYSTKLSKRIKNGLIETRAKGNFTGGQTLLGFKVVDHKVVIDEEKAPIIRYIFEAYADGVPKTKIVEELNRRGWKTAQGKKFSKNSFQCALRNKKYIGEYYFNNEKIEGYPALIPIELFQRVQERLNKNKFAPATQKAKIEYLLTGKVFCGHCGASMTGTSGTSRDGSIHRYYTCTTKYKKHLCNKKNESKEKLESLVIDSVKIHVTQKENANHIAELILNEYNRFLNTGTVKELERQINGIDNQIDKITDLMIDNATNSAVRNKLNEKANDLSLQKVTLEDELAKLKLAIALPHSKKDILSYLAMFANGDTDDIEFRKRIIDRLINSVYVYDDKILIYFNILDDSPISFDMLPDLEDTELPIDNSSTDTTPCNKENGVLVLNAMLHHRCQSLNRYIFVKGYAGFESKIAES